MTTPRRRRYLRLQLAWALGAALGLAVLGAFSLGAFILLAVLGAVVLDEVLTPVEVRPRWRGRRLRWLAAVGALAVAAVLVGRTLELLSVGLALPPGSVVAVGVFA
ncbi:hypothetical protein [Natronococcus occultus]|uniref:Uncharacterized protein n=1 Tax=Natronococcus occultus SP4 TaxID=694430 RepID=L0K4G5_9EURY|nr:hypothetical protein [Natronococcus occultus]AGB39259.1 hypothetical protein Natoc_3534 [Natronococcus occultus SP4]